MAKKKRVDQDGLDPRQGKGASAQFASMLTADEAAQHLEALSRALRSETVLVEADGETLEAVVGQSVQFSLDVKAGIRGKKSSIRLRLNWDEPKAEPELSITSG